MMNYRTKIILGVFAMIMFLNIPSNSCAQTTKGVANQPSIKKNELLIDLLLNGLKQNHFEGQEIDDQFSEKAYDLYLERLDPNKRFFTQKDVGILEQYKHEIDDQAQKGSYELMELAAELMDKRVEQTEKYYKEILAKPFDFERVEETELDPEKRTFAKDEEELKEYWRQSLKYQVLNRTYNRMEKQRVAEEESDTTVELKTFAVVEEEMREKVLKSHNTWYKRLHKVNMDDRRANYLNALANTFDPHTTFFPPKQKENFDISMSGKLEGIGAQLQEKDGNIKVTRIVPGSASWRQGELKAEDVIIKVAQGDEEPVDIVDMRLDDAVRLIRGPKGTEVRLTVKKIDGEQVVIPIVRDVVILEETYAKSAVMEKEGLGEKVGYIYLPKFYADFSGSGGRSCADDVAKEIEKLKKENVEGLVIDLRNNGGGSLRDVVEMAGLFIEDGPIVQVKKPSINAYSLRDTDSKVQWDKPVIVLVNSFSASASEILAAALQDYGRAVIIGSNSTFGKGTVQQFYDLDNFVSGELASVKPLGVIKLTTQKFYRIDGGATQLRGVVPDIVLPDRYSFIDVGEREHDYAMVWDEITAANYDKANTVTNLDKVVTKSKLRTEDNEVFQLVLEDAERLKVKSDDTQYNLHYDIYSQKRKKQKDEADKYKDMMKEIEGLKVATPAADEEHINEEESRIERNDEWHKNLKKDIYIDEALSVMNDLIIMENTKGKVTKREE